MIGIANLAAMKALAGWKGYAVAVLAGALVSGGAAWVLRGQLKDGEIAEIQLTHSLEQQARDRATLDAFDQLIAENSRRYAAKEAEIAKAHESAKLARLDAAAQRGAAERLRRRAERMAADAVARNPTLSEGGPATGEAFDMLAHVLGRALDAAGQLAAYADEARIAGLTCEAQYDSLHVSASK